MTRRFQVGDTTVSAGDPQLGPALGMRTRAGSGRSVSAATAAPMYVARVAGQFIAKRMPGTGVQHDPGAAMKRLQSSRASGMWSGAPFKRMLMPA